MLQEKVHLQGLLIHVHDKLCFSLQLVYIHPVLLANSKFADVKSNMVFPELNYFHHFCMTAIHSNTGGFTAR